jgi:hypothetical protein
MNIAVIHISYLNPKNTIPEYGAPTMLRNEIGGAKNGIYYLDTKY